MTDPQPPRARLVGINHVALDVGSIDEALDFYGTIFEFTLRGRSESMAFLDMGDQFLALAAGESSAGTDDHRHVGLVVDDPRAVERRLDGLDVERFDEADFCDPWGNRLQIVAYEAIQFTKAEHVLDAMGMGELEKSASAIAELAEKDMAPE